MSNLPNLGKYDEIMLKLILCLATFFSSIILCLLLISMKLVDFSQVVEEFKATH